MPEPHQPVEPWLSKAQLAEHLKVSTRAIDGWLQEDPPCPHLTIGVRRRFKPSHVEVWLRHRHATRAA